MTNSRGFTLVETMISLSVTGICFALCLPFLGLQREVWEKQTAVREEFETLSSALQWLGRDLQGAGYGWKSSPVSEIGATSISYVVPAEGGGGTAAGREALRLITAYVREGDLLYRIRGWDSLRGEWKRGSSHKLASNLKALSFTGLAAGGEVAAAAEDVRAVVIEFEGRLSGKHRTFISLRNGLR